MRLCVLSQTKMVHNAGKGALGYDTTADSCRLAARWHPPLDTMADLNPTGKTVPVYARTHSTRTPRLLHPKVAGDRGKFPIDDHDTSFTTTTTAAHHCHGPYEEMYVCHSLTQVALD